MNKELILEELRNALDSYLLQNPTRNLVSLAKQSKVSESSLRRLYNQQAMPSPDNLVKILTTISDERSLYRLAKSFGKEVEKYLTLSFPNLVHEASSDTKVISQEDSLRDFHKYLVFKRVSHSDKVTRQDISSLLGGVGIQKLDELIEEELITENSEGLLTTSTKEFALSLDLYKKHCPQLIDLFFKPQEALNAGLSMIRNISDSVNVVGFEEAMKILTKASTDIFKVIKSNPGNIPLLYLSMIDTLALNNTTKTTGENNE